MKNRTIRMLSVLFMAMVFLLPNLVHANNTETNTINPGPVIGEDAPSEAGEVKLYKEAKQAKDDEGNLLENTWDISLRIEALDKVEPTSIVLVVDESASMRENGKDFETRSALNQFLEAVKKDHQALRDNVYISVVTYEKEPEIKIENSNNFKDIKNVIDSYKAKIGNGTNTQGGLKKASDILVNSSTQNNHIVLLSDGMATYSYKMKNPTNYLIPYVEPNEIGDNKQTSTEIPANEFIYGELSGRSGQKRAYGGDIPGGGEYDRWYYNHANSAIAEASNMKNTQNNLSIWTVALDTDEEASQNISEIASGPEYTYKANTDNIGDIYKNISKVILKSVKQSVVTDKLGKGFNLVGNVAGEGVTFDHENNTISWKPNLDKEISPIHYYDQISYRITTNDEIKDAEPELKNGRPFYYTNEFAKVTYNDYKNELVKADFPKPQVFVPKQASVPSDPVGPGPIQPGGDSQDQPGADTPVQPGGNTQDQPGSQTPQDTPGQETTDKSSNKTHQDESDKNADKSKNPNTSADNKLDNKDSKASNNPKTGDIALLGSAALIIISVLAYYIVSKKK